MTPTDGSDYADDQLVELCDALEQCVKKLRRCAVYAGNAPFAVDAICEPFEAAIAKARAVQS